MLKNIDIGTLLQSKTFWAGLSAFGATIGHGMQTIQQGNKMGGIMEILLGFSVFLGAIGIKDATSGPVN